MCHGNISCKYRIILKARIQTKAYFASQDLPSLRTLRNRIEIDRVSKVQKLQIRYTKAHHSQVYFGTSVLSVQANEPMNAANCGPCTNVLRDKQIPRLLLMLDQCAIHKHFFDVN